MVLNIHKFQNMIEEPIPEAVLAGGENCSRHCIDLNDFLECDVECHNAPFRRLAVRVLKNINDSHELRAN
jgi:hypothetical protein